jgi:phosphoglycolate phosphatase
MPVRFRKTLLLDLDGTLLDPGPGIVGSFRHAMESVGAPVPEDQDLAWIIGPPLRVTLQTLLAKPADADAALQHYRDHYAAWGLYQAAPYPGIFEALQERRAAGVRLLLCTAKAAVIAAKVVEHFGFAPLLSAVYGPDLDGRFDDKGDLIARILDVEGLDPGEVCMVGDREHDVRAASRNGVPTVGVAWGYGGREELARAGAELIIEHPSELCGRA